MAHVLFDNIFKILTFLKIKSTLSFEREIFTYPDDNGTVALDWLDHLPSSDDPRPLVLILPGLGNNNTEVYL